MKTRFASLPARFHKENREEGFTLIELLVVILIIGILAAIAIPAFLHQRKVVNDAMLKVNLKNSSMVIETGRVSGNQKDGDFELDEGVTIHTTWGEGDEYCFRGTMEGSNYEGTRYLTFDSAAGGLRHDASGVCGFVAGEGGGSTDTPASASSPAKFLGVIDERSDALHQAKMKAGPITFNPYVAMAFDVSAMSQEERSAFKDALASSVITDEDGSLPDSVIFRNTEPGTWWANENVPALAGKNLDDVIIFNTMFDLSVADDSVVKDYMPVEWGTMPTIEEDVAENERREAAAGAYELAMTLTYKNADGDDVKVLFPVHPMVFNVP